ncbi:hypothetical protein [Paenibacillus senegalimassiliensis]|uniref:hypothetical protein n=1 Tax=Paenibacillus senegalimassiliensis TaxID=1737426 RepID=UPI00073EAC3F|nr:hypothetical protein [Paenibacillus senegalimassiliensis]
MAKKRQDAEKLVTVQAAVPVVIWRSMRPLTEQQHEFVAQRLQAEQERSGLKVMLLPYGVELEIGAALEEQQATTVEVEQPNLPSAEGTEEQQKEQSSTDGGNDE